MDRSLMNIGSNASARSSLYSLYSNRRVRTLLLVGLLLATLAVDFRYQIQNGFTRLLSGRFDGSIEVAILEHWYNALRGHEPWGTTNYFFPHESTLAYNDGYFLYGLPYSMFRELGSDPYLASELVNIVIRAFGFVAFFLMLLRVFRLTFGWSVFGATLFSLNSSLALHADHEQLQTVNIAPMLAVLVHGTLASMTKGRVRDFLFFGLGAGITMASWLLTAYYMAWFTFFFMLFLVPILIVLLSREERATIGAAVVRRWPLVTLVLVAAILLLVPFLGLYLPKARSTGMWRFSEPAYYLLLPLDIIHVGQENLVWGGLDQWLYERFQPDLARFSEHTVGIAPGLLVVFLLGLWFAWRRQTRGNGAALVCATATAAVLSWIFVVRVDNIHPWHMVYEALPGAKALRAISRYQLFLAVPVTAVAVVTLARLQPRLPRALLTLLCVFLLAEEITAYGHRVRFDRGMENAFLKAVPAPPEQCHAFFVSRPQRAYSSVALDANYSHNVDGMMLSETLHLPTINGFSTFNPPDWDFSDKDHAAYMRHVQDYASRHQIKGLCALDLEEMRWAEDPFRPGS
jgi:hypothetical protein